MEENCNSVMCPNCIMKRRAFLEHAIKNDFCPFKMRVIYKRENLVVKITDSSLAMEKFAYNLNSLEIILNEINEPDDSPIKASINKQIENSHKMLEIEKTLSTKYNNQIDILYELLQPDERAFFEDDDDDEDDDEEYDDDDRTDSNSEASTEIETVENII
jgi:hypothetical protein